MLRLEQKRVVWNLSRRGDGEDNGRFFTSACDFYRGGKGTSDFVGALG